MTVQQFILCLRVSYVDPEEWQVDDVDQLPKYAPEKCVDDTKRFTNG